MMADSPNAPLVIARIYPNNAAAEQALDRVVYSEEVSDYHHGFLDAGNTSGEPDSPAESEVSDQENDAWIAPLERDAQLWAGHFLLSFSDLAGVGQALSWRAGKGAHKLKNRGVELLVVPPRGKGHRCEYQSLPN